MSDFSRLMELALAANQPAAEEAMGVVAVVGPVPVGEAKPPAASPIEAAEARATESRRK